MLELRGKYANCKIFSDKVDDMSISQVYQFLNHPAFDGRRVRFMPDIHAGAGAVIGTTVELGDKVIPNVVGVDIGCGMLSVKLHRKNIDLPWLDWTIKKEIPSGFNVRNKKSTMLDSSLEKSVREVCTSLNIKESRVLNSIGTLGGGNHFIELGEDEKGEYWLTVHTGSRNFGLQIAKYHQKVAQKSCEHRRVNLTDIPEKERENYKKDNPVETLSRGMEYLEGDELRLYLEHMKIAQEFASCNRRAILGTILVTLGEINNELVESTHNYIDFERGIIRKGAISANKGQKVIIPWNMRDGLIIGEGKGNSDWNYSAPHGAGRIMSRSKAKKEVTLEEFKETMDGVYSSSVCKSTIDESPMAYKDFHEVEKYLSESVTTIHRVKPIYNFKAK